MSYLIDNGAHIDRALTNFAVQGFAGRQGYIADRLFPSVPVGRQSDYYYIVEPAEYLLIPDTKRAPGTPANLGDYKLSSAQYFADNYAFGAEYPNEILSNADLGAAGIRQGKVNYVLDVLARDKERRIANIITSISNVGSGVALTGTARWSDSVGSDPVGDINSAHAFIRGRTGLRANVMAIDYDTVVTLQRHPQIRDYVKYTTAGPVPLSELANLFRVQRIEIADGIFNGAKEGATSSLTNIWGNFCSLLHVEAGQTMQTMTFGLQFSWRPEDFPAAMAVERYKHHNRSKKTEIVEAQYFSDEIVVARDLSYTLTGTL